MLALLVRLAVTARAGHTSGATFPTLRADAVKRLLDVKEPVVLEDGFDGWYRSQYPLVK